MRVVITTFLIGGIFIKELTINNTVFESIKHVDENGEEYWLARELQKALEYKEWRKFNGVINKAIRACKGSDINSFDHFVQTDKMIEIAKGGKRIIKDYMGEKLQMI